MAKFILISSVTVIFLCQISMAKDCEKPCPACPVTPKCATGVSLVQDECGCCKTCSKQLHESCDSANPCDHHKNLYCSFGDIDEPAGICVAKPGRSCFLDGKVYLNGESFTRGCKFVCTCIDSDIGCAPTCPVRPAIPRGCDHPHLIKKPGQCCEEWTCVKSRSEPKLAHLRHRLGSKRIRHEFEQHNPFNFAAARRRPTTSLAVRADNACALQTTQWSACSKTCGWGVSERVTNDNKPCRMRKEIRLCQTRPCGENFTEHIKKGKKCMRTTKSTKPVRYSFSGCRSKVYTPKYCGQCTDGRCCSPERTKTVKVTFRCDDGRSFKKNMMQIKSCSCDKCAETNNLIFHSHRSFGATGDTRKE